MTRYLVTGSTGYIGRNMTQRLLALPGADVYGFNRKNDGALPPERFLAGDLLSADLLRWLEEVRPEVVFHAVGTSPKSPFENQLQVNAEGTRRLLQTLLDTGVSPKVIVVGSAAEYGLQDRPVDEETICRPEGEYGISKLAQTQIAQMFARRHGMHVLVGRIFNAYGRTDRHLVVASLAAQIVQAEADAPQPAEIHVQNLRSKRDFVYIDDAVDALLKLSEMERHAELSGQVYNIAAGQSTAISTVLDELRGLTRLNEQELHQVELKLHGLQQEDISWADILKIRQHTGWEPKISLREGLRQELDYWRTKTSAAATVA